MALKKREAATSWRRWSWALWCASFAPVVFFIYQNWLASKWAQEQLGKGAFVCGTGIFALAIACLFLSAALSVAGFLLGVVGYVKVEKPRPKERMLEVALLGLVPLAGLFLLAGLLSL
jgi:hypothetical protein